MRLWTDECVRVPAAVKRTLSVRKLGRRDVLLLSASKEEIQSLREELRRERAGQPRAKPLSLH
jgi:hypothetical protein